VGEEVVEDLVGRRVLLEGPHASHHVVDSGLQAVPDSLPSEHAAWFALAQIAFRGFWRSDARVGDAIVVIGAGPIGQMVVRWASAAGVASTVVDPLAVRLEHARAGGASTVQASPLGDAAMEPPDGPRPAIWIETTGNAGVFAEVLKRAPRFGRVVLLGDAGDPAQQHLTSDVLQKDLTIAGAFGAQTTADWPLQSVRQLFLDFAAAGRFPLGGLITNRFRPEECLVAYQRLVEDRASIMAGAFVWNESP
jgi:threonine dehydrogenase-like Zn-dependent dehydrogenase